MDKIRLLIYCDSMVSIITLTLVLMSFFPVNYLMDISTVNVIISILFLFFPFQIRKKSFFKGCLFAYTLVTFLFSYHVVDLFLYPTRDALLGYQFVAIYYSGIPVILAGGLISLIITVYGKYYKKTKQK